MAKSSKINDFRKLNVDAEDAPTTKKVGATSASKKNKNSSRKSVAKASKQSTPKKHGVGIAIFSLLLIIAGVFVGCMFTPVFNVSNINVRDGNYVSSAEIMNKLDNVAGENILRVNIDALEKEVASIPYIRDVEIKRRLPDTIDIVFEERQPYALIKYLESYIVMDKYGYVLEIKKENDLQDLAIIYGIDINEFNIGDKLEDVAALKYENITYLLETSYKGDFDYNIYEINYSDTEKLIMATKEFEIDINFGKIEKSILSEKMAYLNGILKKLNGRKGNLDISSNNYLEKTIFTERY